MVSKSPVLASYEAFLQCSPADMRTLSSFFQQTLSVQTMDWEDLTAELSLLQNAGSNDEAHIARIYGYIKALATTNTAGELRFSGNTPDGSTPGDVS